MYKPYDENQFICGLSGQGKSTLLKEKLRELPKSIKVLLWDPNNQHSDLIDNGGFSKYQGGEIKGKVIHVPRDGSPTEFDILVEQAMRQGNVVVVVEEAQEVMNSSSTRTVLRWLRTGRNRGVTYIAVTQIPMQCRDSVLSNAHYVHVFKLRRPDDTGYVAGWLGISREAISSLKKFEYIAISQDGEPEYYRLKPVGIMSQIISESNDSAILSRAVNPIEKRDNKGGESA
jgi:DNA helicase HerA-like ATPase